MTEAVTVRAASSDDSDAVLRLWTDLVNYHKTLERVRPARWSGPAEDTLRTLSAQVWAQPDRRAILVAEAAGEIVGFVRLALTDDGPCAARIDTLFVAEAFRGRYVGTRLLDCAYAWCRDREAREVCVEFIAPNDLAREFYERAGFQPLLATYMRRI